MNLDEELDDWGRTREIDDEQLLALIRKCESDDPVIAVEQTEDSIPIPIWDDLATPPAGSRIFP